MICCILSGEVITVDDEVAVIEEGSEQVRARLLSLLTDRQKRLTRSEAEPIVTKWANHFFLFMSLKSDYQRLSGMRQGNGDLMSM